MANTISVIGLGAVPEVRVGDDYTQLVLEAASADDFSFQAGDILVVTQKIVSKAEGMLVDLREVQPGEFAKQFAATWDKDPRQVEVVLRESVRIVKMERGIIISETRHGFICANAGVDMSNVAGYDYACLLPKNSDASAECIRHGLREQLGLEIPVIISDSFGRAWRNGITNIAIGVAGMQPLLDYRGTTDAHGYLMHASIIAVADEIASAAELVMNKIDGVPLAVVRGYKYAPGVGSGQEIVMEASRDMFR